MTAACGCIGIFDHPYAYPSLTCTQDALQKKALPTSQAECPPSAFLTSCHLMRRRMFGLPPRFIENVRLMTRLDSLSGSCCNRIVEGVRNRRQL